MELKEIKNTIENSATLPDVLIFKCKSEASRFIFSQYLREYSTSKNLEVEFIEDFSVLQPQGLFTNTETCGIMYVYETTKLEKFPVVKDKIVWVKCTSVDNNTKKLYGDYIVEVPNVEDWQVKDYINTNLKETEEKHKQLLYDNYRNNLFRLELEVEKLKPLQQEYKQIENQLYVDSTTNTIFDITNCILKKDLDGLRKLKDDINVIDIDAFGLLKILTTNFRHVIDIQLSKNPTPEYVGVTSKQFWAIKNLCCNFYTKDELTRIYTFLIGIDNKIKSGQLKTDMVVDYIICKIILGG